MSYLKLIFKSLYKNKLKNFLIIIQMTITICIILSSFILIESINYSKNQVQKRNLDLDRTIHLKLCNVTQTKAFKDNFNELETYIKGIPEVSNMGGFHFTNFIFNELENNDSYINLRKNAISDTFKEEFPSTSEMLTLDAGIYDLLNLNIIKGNGLSKNDFYKEDEEVTPILAGSNYINILEIGQILTRKNTNCKYKIIGFIDKHSTWIDNQNYINNMPITLDDKFIIPYKESEKVSITKILSKSNAIFYVVNDKSQIKYVTELIDDKAQSLNISAKSISISNDLNEFEDSTKDNVRVYKFLSIFMVVVSCSGLSMILLTSILARKRQFGIMLSTGISISYLKMIIIGENGIIVLISSINALIITLIKNLSLYKYQKYNDIIANPMQQLGFVHLLFTLAIMIILIILTTTIPLRYFKDFSIKEMIGGKD